MTNAEINIFFQTVAILAALLLLGTFLRAKVKLFQTLFLPACVIGGVIGLILGPRVLGLLPISEEIMTTASNLPGRLFGVIIAALPMCAQKLKKEDLMNQTDGVQLGIIITLISALQFVVGFAVNVVSNAMGLELYDGYGAEMMLGFCGGHGTASTIGTNFQNLGMDYWELAQGCGMTFATLGMVGGILAGIYIINRYARKGLTNYVTNPKDLPREMKTGLYSEPEECPSAGRQTTAGGSIDTLGLHFALIMFAVGAGYLNSRLIKTYQIPLLIYMADWFWMLIAMYIIWPVIRLLGWDKYFDPSIKSKIQGCCTDFVVASAIMSMPISMVLELWLPILVSAVLGFLVTVPIVLILCRHYMHEDWVEKSMGPIGMLTGDFITGVLLTRMLDPDFKSTAMGDFSIAYSLNTFYCVVLAAVIFPYVVNNGAFSAMIFVGSHAVVLAILMVVFGRITRNKKRTA